MQVLQAEIKIIFAFKRYSLERAHPVFPSRKVRMSISAWAQACASQASRSKQSLEQSSYASNAFTVRFPVHHLPVLLPLFKHFRLYTAHSKKFSCAASLQIASFSISFLVSAYWLLLWIRFKRRSRSSPAEISRPSDDIPGTPEKIWRHYGLFAALVCAGRQRAPLTRRTLQTIFARQRCISEKFT